MVDLQHWYDDAWDGVQAATTGRNRLTLVNIVERRIFLGQSITVADLSSARRVVDLSNMINLKAISSVESWKVKGIVGVGDKTSIL